MGDNTTHSALSPSARHRWGACPGSVREEAKYPEPPDTAASIDGTRTHAILEQCVRNRQRIEAQFIGSKATDEYGEYVWDQARIDRVNLALDYIWSRPGAENAIAETRVFPDGFLDTSDCSGTVDVQIPGKDLYEIIDYKDGMAPVQAKDNPQLELYALGALAGLAPENYPKTVRMTIIQPKLALKGMPPITSHDISVADLMAKVPIIKAEVAATEDPNAPLVPGESQCKYCKAKGACPALANKAMQEVNLMFDAIPQVVTPEVIPAGVLDPAQQAAAQDPNQMSDEQLRKILEAAPLVRQMLEGVEAEVKRRLESGKPVPGFKLVQGRGSRKWALPDEEIAKKLKGMGVPKEAIWKTDLVSVAQAEKLTWTDKEGKTCQLSDKQLERLRKEYVASQAGKPTVAPESDSREAIVLDASPMFEAIEPPVESEGPLTHNSKPVWEVAAPAEVPAWLTVPAWLQ